ncbi:MAG TPA: hypothetical protein VGK61_03100 [Planctomycetota bacterium]|jgi:hypothetical protein
MKQGQSNGTLMKVVLVLTPLAVLANTILMGRDHGFQTAVSLFTSACLSFVAGTFVVHLRHGRQSSK